MSSYRFKLIGQLINLLGLLSSPAAGRTAFALFSRTQPSEPKTAKEKALFQSARHRMNEAEIVALKVGVGTVAAHVFPPLGTSNGRKFLVLHGWGSRIDYLQALVTGLRNTGAEVVALDLPGHGQSTGRTLTVVHAIHAIDAAWQNLGPFDATVGHSFGGYCLAISAAGPSPWLKRRRTPERLVIVASPVSAIDVFDQFAQSLGLTKRVHAALNKRVEAVTGLHISEFVASDMLQTEPGLPTLVLHAEDDKEVHESAARRYAEAGPHVTLKWMNGLGHRRIVSSPEVIDAIKTFVTSAP